MWKSYRLFLLTLLAACGVESSSSGPEADPTPFFNLEAYFDREIARLDSLQPLLLKKVTVDGKTEEKQFENTDYESEFQIFRRSDINRPAWTDKYTVDSLQNNGVLQSLRYTALDTSLTTRLLEVGFRNGEVQEIQVQNRARSPIAQTEQNLLYIPDRSYQIESKQKTIGSEVRRILIEVEVQN